MKMMFCKNLGVGKHLGFYKNCFRFLVSFGFQVFLLTNAGHKNYDPQAKNRPCERHKSQFIFEYHLY